MRAYSRSNEEARLARDLLHDWRGQGFITPEQYQRMEQETPCDLRRTNIFLRAVLFFFTVVIVAAFVGLFFISFLKPSGDQTLGIFLLIFAALCYAAAEITVSQARFYRYGIEEALIVFAVGFLCAGIHAGLSYHLLPYGSAAQSALLVPSACALASLWIWLRFGLFYALVAAVFSIAWVPCYFVSSTPTQCTIVAAFYASALIAVVALRPRHRFTYLNHDYSIAEALLWLSLYVALNVKVLSVDALGPWLRTAQVTPQSDPIFYWATWVLTWLIPAVVLTRGLRQNDRLVIAAGIATAFLTLLTNKLYLGWPRHSWDPMLLGALFIGIALLIRRWLAQKPDGIRQGFTAQRLSGKDKSWMNIGVTAIGLASPNILTAHPPPSNQPPSPQFSGGDSGGAGASSDF